jgi:hypothetical protein
VLLAGMPLGLGLITAALLGIGAGVFWEGWRRSHVVGGARGTGAMNLWLTVFAMGAISWALRASTMAGLGDRELPEWLRGRCRSRRRPC